jgi:hypothetical protein
MQWVPGAFSLGVKRPGREADRSPPSSTEVKEWVELHIDSPNTPPWRGAQLKHRDSFTLLPLYYTKDTPSSIFNSQYRKIVSNKSYTSWIDLCYILCVVLYDEPFLLEET